MKNLKKTGGRMLFFLPLGLIVLLFECVPLFGMVTKAFGGDGGFTLDYFREIIEKPVYQTAVLNSLWVTMTCTIVGLVIDFFLAMALSRSKGRGKALYLSILNLTSSFSGLPLSIAFITILGTAGRIRSGGAGARLRPAGELQLIHHEGHVHRLPVLPDSHGDASFDPDL